MAFLLIIGVVLIVAAGVALWKWRSFSQRMEILRRAVPASATDVANAYPGEVMSLTGTARCDQQLVSEQTQTPCIYYDFEIVRRYERNRRGGVSVGRRRRRRGGRQRGRETVAENTQWSPFLVEDQSGQARIYPDGAYFEARQVLNRYEPEGSNNLFGIPGLDINIGMGNRTLGYEIKESVIPADAQVFVAGTVDENGQLSSSGQNGMIVSYRNESALRDEWGSRENQFLYGGVIGGGLGILLLFIAAVQWVVTSI